VTSENGSRKIAATLTDEGRALLDKGDFEGAIHKFALAFKFLGDVVTVPELSHLNGISLRLKGDFVAAELNLQEAIRAYESRNDPSGAARTKRDLAMVYLDQGNYTAAGHWISVSIDELRLLGNVLEAAVSWGFDGRLKYLIGDYVGAAEAYEAADRILRNESNRVYELNNLAWYLKLDLDKKKRRVYGRRARRLAIQTRNWPRFVQVAMLSFAPSIGRKIG
jgi:tetratricopeptide (TPR) repeat protein